MPDGFENNTIQVHYSDLILQNTASKYIESAESYNMLGPSIYNFENIGIKKPLEFKTKYKCGNVTKSYRSLPKMD